MRGPDAQWVKWLGWGAVILLAAHIFMSMRNA